jgi:hypothetical protein
MNISQAGQAEIYNKVLLLKLNNKVLQNHS